MFDSKRPRRSTRSSPRPAASSSRAGAPRPHERVAAAQAASPAKGSSLLGACSPTRWGSKRHYAFLSFTQGERADPRRETAIRKLDARLPRPEPDAPYLEVELAVLPQIVKPRSSPSGLSTGQAPLESRASGHRGGSAAPGVASPHPLRVPLAGPRPECGLPLRVKYRPAPTRRRVPTAITRAACRARRPNPGRERAARPSVANTPGSTVNAVAAPRSRNENATTVSRSAGSGSSQQTCTSAADPGRLRNSPVRKSVAPRVAASRCDSDLPAEGRARCSDR